MSLLNQDIVLPGPQAWMEAARQAWARILALQEMLTVTRSALVAALAQRNAGQRARTRLVAERNAAVQKGKVLSTQLKKTAGRLRRLGHRP